MEDKVAPDPSGEVFDKLAKYLLLMQHKQNDKNISVSKNPSKSQQRIH